MQYGQVAGIEKPLSRLIQGTLALARMPSEQAFQLLDGVYEAGCRVFDTAPVYGQGLAETNLGAWLSTRAPKDVVVIDKGGHPRAGESRVTPQEIASDLERSREQLGVETIDLYLLHRDQPEVPVSELVDFLNREVEKGTIRRFGASNWSQKRIVEANRYAEKSGQLGFVASSPEFNLLVPVASWWGCLSISGKPGAEERAWYGETRLPVMAWSPLAGGFLTGAYTTETVPSSDRERRVLRFYASRENFERLARLIEFAQKRGESPSTLALAYVLSSGMNTYATVGCASKAEFREVAKALDLPLTAEELCWLQSGESTRPQRSKL